MIPFFRKRNIVSQEKENLEKEFHEAKARMDTISRELHKKKSFALSKTALELVLDGLSSGKLKKEEL